MVKTFLGDSFSIQGVKLIEGFEIQDERGGSAKVFSYTELGKDGIDFYPLEILTINSKKNVVRGLHFQREKGQSKLISCIMGEMFVAVVDLRMDSETFGEWSSAILTKPSQSIYIPVGCAVGTMALADSIFVCACGENAFIPEYATGIQWNDEDIAINWPDNEGQGFVISEKDRSLPTFREYTRFYMNKERELGKKCRNYL